MKLVQKRILNQTREFEIAEDAVHVRIKGLLKEKNIMVGLSMLNPNPVQNGSELEFHSRTKQSPLLSLMINKPDPATFATFVDTLIQKLVDEENTFGGTLPPAPGWNVYEAPQGFEEIENAQDIIGYTPVNAERLANDITMLKTYLDEETFKALIDSLETLKANPDNETAYRQVLKVYKDSVINQGAVLTYAPYLKILLSQSSWL